MKQKIYKIVLSVLMVLSVGLIIFYFLKGEIEMPVVIVLLISVYLLVKKEIIQSFKIYGE